MILTAIKDLFTSKKHYSEDLEKSFTLLGTYNVIIRVKKWSLNEYTLFIIFKNASKTDIAQSPIKFVEEFFKPKIKNFFEKFGVKISDDNIEVDCKERRDLYIMIKIDEEEKNIIEKNFQLLEKVVGEVVGSWREGLLV